MCVLVSPNLRSKSDRGYSMLLLFRQPITHPIIVFTFSPTSYVYTNSTAIDLITMEGPLFLTTGHQQHRPFWTFFIDIGLTLSILNAYENNHIFFFISLHILFILLQWGHEETKCFLKRILCACNTIAQYPWHDAHSQYPWHDAHKVDSIFTEPAYGNSVESG